MAVTAIIIFTTTVTAASATTDVDAIITVDYNTTTAATTIADNCTTITDATTASDTIMTSRGKIMTCVCFCSSVFLLPLPQLTLMEHGNSSLLCQVIYLCLKYLGVCCLGVLKCVSTCCLIP